MLICKKLSRLEVEVASRSKRDRIEEYNSMLLCLLVGYDRFKRIGLFYHFL